jgi:hypothetical protein
LKKKALDRTLCRTRFWRGYEPVARQTAWWWRMEDCCLDFLGASPLTKQRTFRCKALSCYLHEHSNINIFSLVYISKCGGSETKYLFK